MSKYNPHISIDIEIEEIKNSLLSLSDHSKRAASAFRHLSMILDRLNNRLMPKRTTSYEFKQRLQCQNTTK